MEEWITTRYWDSRGEGRDGKKNSGEGINEDAGRPEVQMQNLPQRISVCQGTPRGTHICENRPG